MHSAASWVGWDRSTGAPFRHMIHLGNENPWCTIVFFHRIHLERQNPAGGTVVFCSAFYIGYIGGAVMLYTSSRHEDKNSAHCTAWRTFTPGKRAKQIRWCCCCGAACSESAEAQLAVVIGKPACWWLLPRLTISTVEKKAQRAFCSWRMKNYAGSFLRTRRGFLDCVGFLLVRPCYI